jgi:hypothetical protein
MSGWRYDRVPRRGWGWKADPNDSWSDDIGVETTPDGLFFDGFVHNPNWGGGYTIGLQTYDAFLSGEPLDASMPENIRAEIREHLAAHRRAGPVARLLIVAEIKRPQAEALSQISCRLGDAHIAFVRPSELAEGDTVTVFDGAVQPKKRRELGAAVAWGPTNGGTVVHLSAKLDCREGTTTKVTFHVGDHQATVRVTKA